MDRSRPTPTATLQRSRDSLEQLLIERAMGALQPYITGRGRFFFFGLGGTYLTPADTYSDGSGCVSDSQRTCAPAKNQVAGRIGRDAEGRGQVRSATGRYTPPDKIVDPVRVELLFGHGAWDSSLCMGAKRATVVDGDEAGSSGRGRGGDGEGSVRDGWRSRGRQTGLDVRVGRWEVFAG